MSPPRTVVIGAGTLLGRELVERLRADGAGKELTLVELGDGHGVVRAVGGELEVSVPWLAESLEGAEVVLCCADMEPPERDQVLQAAATACVVDLTGTLGGEPFDSREGTPPAKPGLLSSPSGASLLVAALGRAAGHAGASLLTATVLEPASELGQAALDELYQQAVAMLNFQPMPTDVLGRQLVHDVASPGPPGSAAREKRLRDEVQGLLPSLPVTLVRAQAGVFHGVAVAARADVPADEWRRALRSQPRMKLAEGVDEATPVASVQQEHALVGRVEDDGRGGAWAWAAADTLTQGSVGNVIEWTRARANAKARSQARQ